MEHADSWVTDGHKVLQLPQDHGFCFIRNEQAHIETFSIHAAYALTDHLKRHDESDLAGMLSLSGPPRDQYMFGLEWSRRAKGYTIYATLRHLGRQGVARLFENMCQQAIYLVDSLDGVPNIQVVSKPIINQGLVRFVKDGNIDASDQYTDHIIAVINESRRVWFGGTMWKGMRVMRISVCSHLCSKEDVDEAVNIIRTALLESTDCK